MSHEVFFVFFFRTMEEELKNFSILTLLDFLLNTHEKKKKKRSVLKVLLFDQDLFFFFLDD